MEHLVGTGVALVTPFTEDRSVDTEALVRIVDYCIEGGVDYLVVLGTTGESVTLDRDEKQLVMDTVVRANAGRLPLVLGIGSNYTDAVVKELKEVDLSDFEAVLSVSPYYNRPTQEGIYQHFKAISEASPKPVILYNVPGRTGTSMLPSTSLRLARDFENIVAIKEASGDIGQLMQLIKGAPEGFLVISGDDITALPTVLAGGAGVISVIGQGLPAEFTRMVRLGLEGDVTGAYALHYRMMDAMYLIFQEGNPAGIKAIFELLGLSTAYVRLPLVEASEQLRQQLAGFIGNFSKIPA
ncbi:MAG: 4-hydroxy-tetrahydrodipicolinate synthase [Sediminicola sp.]